MTSMQITKQKRTTKQQGIRKKKGVLPFNKQLLDLQKKIQQVEDKNEKILQQINKAYNFKKKKIYYEAPHEVCDEQNQYNGQHGQQYMVQSGQNYTADRLPGYYMTTKHPTISPTRKGISNGRGSSSGSPSHQGRYYQSIQPQYVEQFPQLSKSQSQQLLNQLQELKQLQGGSPLPYSLHPNKNQRQQKNLPDQDDQNDYSHVQAQYRSTSDYSDVQRRMRINELVDLRQNQFSDIKSSIEEGRMRTQINDLQLDRKHPHRNSILYNDMQNYSLYSEGHVPSRQRFQPEGLQIIQVPVTASQKSAKRLQKHRVPYPQPLKFTPPGQSLITYSTQQLYCPQHYPVTQSKLPVSPVSNQYSVRRHSFQGKNPPYQQNHAISQSQVSFLQQMFRKQRQKTANLQKQIEFKDEKMTNLKRYKKNFKNFINTTYYVIQEAFDQYVEYFVKNKLYHIEKIVKKNENRLSTLLISLKDIKEERIYNRSLKRHFQGKNKISYYSNDNNHQSQKRYNRHDSGTNLPQQSNLDQNRSTVSSRSRQRSVSVTKKRNSKDKSVTKKSNQSQVMKKQFKNIAQKYEAMLKVKNEQIEKLQIQLKQNKHITQALEEQNVKIKLNAQLPSAELSGSELQGRKSPGNLRILSRSSSKSQLKRNPNNAALSEQNEQLSQKIRKYQKQLAELAEQKSSVQEVSSKVLMRNSKYQTQVRELQEKIQVYQTKQSQMKHEKNLRFQQQKGKLLRSLQESQGKGLWLNGEVQRVQLELKQKDKKVSQLESGLYLKDSEVKKLQNLLQLKSFKLQQLNKIILSPSTSQPQSLNDSISSIMQQPQNRATFVLLQDLQRQLQNQKHQKQLQFLKLKKSYQHKMQQLRVQCQEIASENNKLQQKLRQQGQKRQQLNDQIQQKQQVIQSLRAQIQVLNRQVAELNQNANFYQAEGGTGRTGSFAGNVNEMQSSLPHQHSQNNFNYRSKVPIRSHELDDFPEQQMQNPKLIHNSLASYQCGSGQLQLLDQSSSMTGTFNPRRSPSVQQDMVLLKRVDSLGQNNMPQIISVIKNQNIDLSQKVAKLEKQNKFLKQDEHQQARKAQNLKAQLSNFSRKYEELQNYNQEILKMVQSLQRQKNQALQISKQSNCNAPVNWKQIQKHIEPVDLKGSGMIPSWNSASKDDLLLDRNIRDSDIRSSIVSNFNQNRSEQQSANRKIEQLTRKLAQTEVILQNKENMNEGLIIGFTKKIDNLNVQIQQQGKVMQKYIQQNSKLRKVKQRLEEEIQKVQSQNLRLKQDPKLLNSHSDRREMVDEGRELVDDSTVQQYRTPVEQTYNRENQDGSGLMQKRIQVDQSAQQPFSKADKDSMGQATFQPMLQQQQISLQQFQQGQYKIQHLQRQVQQLQQTLEQLQSYLQETLGRVKQKEEQKCQIVQELRRKNQEVEQLRDLIQLKEAGRNTTLNLSKSINQGYPELPSGYRINSLKRSQTTHSHKIGKESLGQQINFDFLDNDQSVLDNDQNHSITLQQSNISAMYSDNVSVIFQKEQNFLDLIKKAKNKRKQEGKLLRKTFQYIRKLRAAINQKDKKIRILQNRIEGLKDNCWLWKKGNQPIPGQLSPGRSPSPNPAQGPMKTQAKRDQKSGIQVDYIDANQSSENQGQKRLVDSSMFQCNSEDLNKRRPRRYNHYKKLQFDARLIGQQNKILTNQIQMLQQQLVKIEQQQTGLMAVKQIYKQEIRALTRQNQQLATTFQQQVQKLQQKLQNSESFHNFEAIKQLFKKIIDNIGVVLYPSIFGDSKKKNINQIKQQKRKQAEECVKVICSILNYDQIVRNQLCSKLMGGQ